MKKIQIIIISICFYNMLFAEKSYFDVKKELFSNKLSYEKKKDLLISEYSIIFAQYYNIQFSKNVTPINLNLPDITEFLSLVTEKNYKTIFLEKLEEQLCEKSDAKKVEHLALAFALEFFKKDKSAILKYKKYSFSEFSKFRMMIIYSHLDIKKSKESFHKHLGYYTYFEKEEIDKYYDEWLTLLNKNSKRYCWMDFIKFRRTLFFNKFKSYKIGGVNEIGKGGYLWEYLKIASIVFMDLLRRDYHKAIELIPEILLIIQDSDSFSQELSELIRTQEDSVLLFKVMNEEKEISSKYLQDVIQEKMKSYFDEEFSKNKNKYKSSQKALFETLKEFQCQFGSFYNFSILYFCDLNEHLDDYFFDDKNEKMFLFLSYLDNVTQKKNPLLYETKLLIQFTLYKQKLYKEFKENEYVNYYLSKLKNNEILSEIKYKLYKDNISDYFNDIFCSAILFKVCDLLPLLENYTALPIEILISLSKLDKKIELSKSIVQFIDKYWNKEIKKLKLNPKEYNLDNLVSIIDLYYKLGKDKEVESIMLDFYVAYKIRPKVDFLAILLKYNKILLFKQYMEIVIDNYQGDVFKGVSNKNKKDISYNLKNMTRKDHKFFVNICLGRYIHNKNSAVEYESDKECFKDKKLHRIIVELLYKHDRNYFMKHLNEIYSNVTYKEIFRSKYNKKVYSAYCLNLLKNKNKKMFFEIWDNLVELAMKDNNAKEHLLEVSEEVIFCFSEGYMSEEKYSIDLELNELLKIGNDLFEKIKFNDKHLGSFFFFYKLFLFLENKNKHKINEMSEDHLSKNWTWRYSNQYYGCHYIIIAVLVDYSQKESLNTSDTIYSFINYIKPFISNSKYFVEKMLREGSENRSFSKSKYYAEFIRKYKKHNIQDIQK